MAVPAHINPRHKSAGILMENGRMDGGFEWETDAGPLWAIGPAPVGCVPGLARLLNGDIGYYDTDIGQSPDPA